MGNLDSSKNPSDKSNWEMFFDLHAPIYDENGFTCNTVSEVDIIIELLELIPNSSILDVGCGTGRHSIELARKGYAMTGIDLSKGMLAQAQEKARALGVSIEWIHADASKFTLPKKFDAAICLCEGAFGLLGIGDDAIEHPLAMLNNICQVLKPGGKVFFTVLNGLLMIRKHSKIDVANGLFDPLTISRKTEYSPCEGVPPMIVRERAFVPTELVLLFRLAGMEVQSIWGGSAGSWKNKTIDPDETELMIIAQKKS